MKKNKKKEEFLEQIRKIPIIQVAAEKTGLSRNTIYRWKKEDAEFCKALDEAFREGEALINDFSESTLLSMIKEKNWPSLAFWLRHHHPKYGNKIEITTPQLQELTPEQATIVREALKRAGSQASIINTNQNDNETNQ